MMMEKKTLEVREAELGLRVARIASAYKSLAVAAYKQDDEVGAARYRLWGKQLAALEAGPNNDEG